MEVYEYVILCTEPADLSAVLDSYDVIIDKMQRRSKAILANPNTLSPIRAIVSSVRKEYPELDKAITTAIAAGGSKGRQLEPNVKRELLKRVSTTIGKAMINTALNIVLDSGIIVPRQITVNGVVERRSSALMPNPDPPSQRRVTSNAQRDQRDETEFVAFKRQMTAQGYPIDAINAKWKEHLARTNGVTKKRAPPVTAAKMTRTPKVAAKAKPSPKVAAKVTTRVPRAASKPVDEEPVAMDEDDHQFHNASLQDETAEATEYEDDDYEDDEFYDEDDNGEDGDEYDDGEDDDDYDEE